MRLAMGPDLVAVLRILAEVETDLHSSGAGGGVSGFERIGLRLFGRDVGVDLRAVGMIVGERGMDLGEREVTDMVRNLLGSQTKPVPADDPAHGHPGSGQARPASADLGV